MLGGCLMVPVGDGGPGCVLRGLYGAWLLRNDTQQVAVRPVRAAGGLVGSGGYAGGCWVPGGWWRGCWVVVPGIV